MKQAIAENVSALRVLFISHTYMVGVNQGKLDAIASTGQAEVGLLAPITWQAFAWGKRMQLEMPFPRIRMFPTKVFFDGRSTAYFHPPLATLRAIRDFQPDILQVEQEILAVSAFEMALWARLTGKALVVFCWENIDRRLPWYRALMYNFVLKSAKLIIAGNQEGADIIRKWGYQGKIAVMPQLGVDNTFFAPQANKQPDREFRIGFVGRLVYEKGIDLILQAAKQLRDRGYAFKVVLCGTGTYETELRQEAQRQQIEDLVVWQGAVRHDEVPQVMNQFDVLVLPSRNIPTWKEQFGHVLIEAMAMGIPVVGSTCGEIPNVIGRSDLVFPQGDAAALAAILERMMREPNWWQAAGQYSLQRVEQHYTHESIAQKLINLWYQIVDLDHPQVVQQDPQNHDRATV